MYVRVGGVKTKAGEEFLSKGGEKEGEGDEREEKKVRKKGGQMNITKSNSAQQRGVYRYDLRHLIYSILSRRTLR